MFCLVEGVIVYGMFVPEANRGFPITTPLNISHEIADHHLFWPIVALAASHLFSFFRNYLGGGEYRCTTAGALMSPPYARYIAAVFSDGRP